MLLDSLGDKSSALALLDDEDTGYAGYYAYRATLNGSRADYSA